MFTKSLSRIALVSGLILGAGSIVPQVALAQTTGRSDGLVTTGTPTAVASIAVAGDGNSFPITFGAAITAQKIATINYYTNVTGNWNIKAKGGNEGKEGQLITVGLDATIPYTVQIGAGTAVAPVAESGLASATALASGEVTTSVLEVTGAVLNINIAASATKVPVLKTTGSAYSETLTLVFTSGL